jgi:hypothetical protein
VAVGTRVFVAVGLAGAGVSWLAVGKKLGKVGVGVMVGGGEVGVGVGGNRRSYGTHRATMTPAKAKITKPIKIPTIIPWERVTVGFPF